CGQEPLEIQALPPQVEPQPPTAAILAPTVPPDSLTPMSRSNGSCAADADAVLTPWSVHLAVTGILRIGPVAHFDSVCCGTADPGGQQLCGLRQSGPRRPPLQTREPLSGRGVGDGTRKSER